jgi:hypothetical protein
MINNLQIGSLAKIDDIVPQKHRSVALSVDFHGNGFSRTSAA